MAARKKKGVAKKSRVSAGKKSTKKAAASKKRGKKAAVRKEPPRSAKAPSATDPGVVYSDVRSSMRAVLRRRFL